MPEMKKKKKKVSQKKKKKNQNANPPNFTRPTKYFATSTNPFPLPSIQGILTAVL